MEDASALTLLLSFVLLIRPERAAFSRCEDALGRCSLFQKQEVKTVHQEGGPENFYSRSTVNFLDILEKMTFENSGERSVCYIHAFTVLRQLKTDEAAD